MKLSESSGTAPPPPHTFLLFIMESQIKVGIGGGGLCPSPHVIFTSGVASSNTQKDQLSGCANVKGVWFSSEGTLEGTTPSTPPHPATQTPSHLQHRLRFFPQMCLWTLDRAQKESCAPGLEPRTFLLQVYQHLFLMVSCPLEVTARNCSTVRNNKQNMLTRPIN